jgi:hypothetical protein
MRTPRLHRRKNAGQTPYYSQKKECGAQLRKISTARHGLGLVQNLRLVTISWLFPIERQITDLKITLKLSVVNEKTLYIVGHFFDDTSQCIKRP